MNIWMIGENLMKYLYLKKGDFYNHLSMEDITDAKVVCKDFEIKIFGEYHNLYVQSDTLLLAECI